MGAATRGDPLWSAFEAAFGHGQEAQWPGRGESAVGVVDFGARFWPPLRAIGIPGCVFATQIASSFWTGKNAHAGGAVQDYVTPAEGAPRGLRKRGLSKGRAACVRGRVKSGRDVGVKRWVRRRAKSWRRMGYGYGGGGFLREAELRRGAGAAARYDGGAGCAGKKLKHQKLQSWRKTSFYPI